jgi:hypothetical protein
MWLDWGIAGRYDPHIIGASFRIPVATARAFASPRTEVWNHVYCLAKCKDGNCKEMKWKYCVEVFAGGAQRIIKHVVKCHSCPSAVTDWGRRRQSAATARKGEKNDAKKLTKAFDGAADDATQQCIKGSIDKLTQGPCDGALPRGSMQLGLRHLAELQRARPRVVHQDAHHPHQGRPEWIQAAKPIPHPHIRTWLDTTFSCTEYKVWIRTQAKDVQQGSAACRAVVNDVDFTSLCADIAAFFGPAIILLRLADTDLPSVSKMVPSSYMCKSKMEEFREKLPFAAICIEKYEKREKDLLTFCTPSTSLLTWLILNSLITSN